MIVACFADGGCIRANPSPYGGTWASCHVDEENQRVWCASGVLLPRDVESKAVTNNASEFYALLMGLEALPAGWSGIACSDSAVTLGRFFGSYQLNGIPREWRLRMYAALNRLGVVQRRLVSGHPTRVQLATGVGRHGLPVSEHNQWCDLRCCDEADAYWARKGVA